MSPCFSTMCEVSSLIVSAYGKQVGSEERQILHWKVSRECASLMCLEGEVE